MPKVYNKARGDAPPDAVYIGRPSKWGNPYMIGRDGTRDACVTKYRAYLLNGPLSKDLHELKGKDLVCWCAPQRCHGDVLLECASVD